MQHIFAAYLNNTFETDGRITACYRTSKAIVFSLSLFHTQTHIQQSLKAHSDNNCFGLLSMPKSLQHAEVNKATADFLTCSFFCVCMSLLTSACNNDVCWTAVEMLAVHFYAQWLETYPSTVVQDVCVRWWWEGVEYVNALYAVLLFVVATNPPPPTPSHVEKSSMTFVAAGVWQSDLCLCEQKLFFLLFWLSRVYDAPIKTVQMQVPN